jgi:hypothetical protein
MIMTKAERERSRMFVRALYDYSTDDPTSLSFRAGDIIQVLKQLDSGWWDGIVNGQRGWFPSNYCILVPPGETNGALLSDDSDDGDEEDSYDEYDNESQSSDSEHGMASPGLPMEGTNLGKTDVTGLWVPQATPHGRLFYFNLETAETRQELPLEAPTSTTESGPRDRSRSIPDQTRPPPEILARGYEREEPLYRSRSDDDDSASEKEGDMLVLNGNTSVVSAQVKRIFHSKVVAVNIDIRQKSASREIAFRIPPRWWAASGVHPIPQFPGRRIRIRFPLSRSVETSTRARQSCEQQRMNSTRTWDRQCPRPGTNLSRRPVLPWNGSDA